MPCVEGTRATRPGAGCVAVESGHQRLEYTSRFCPDRASSSISLFTALTLEDAIVLLLPEWIRESDKRIATFAGAE